MLWKRGIKVGSRNSSNAPKRNTKRRVARPWNATTSFRHRIKLPGLSGGELAHRDEPGGIMRRSCKIAINIAPIFHLRLVDSHISTCLTRLHFARAPLSRFILCESSCHWRTKKTEQKEMKKKTNEREAKNRREKEREERKRSKC